MAARRFAFVSIHATGPDVRSDRVFRLAARLPDGAGAVAEIAWLANPTLGCDALTREVLLERARALSGLEDDAFEGKASASDVFAAFRIASRGEPSSVSIARSCCVGGARS